MENFFAIVDNGKLKHLVKSSIDEFESVKALSLMFENDIIVKIDENTGYPNFENSEFINNKFYDPRPYESWQIIDDRWMPPKKYPNDGQLYFWNEENSSWGIVTEKMFDSVSTNK